MKTTRVNCYECKNEFEKRTADYNHTKRKGGRHFCSCSCSVRCTNKEMSTSRRKNAGEKIKIFSGNRQDRYSPFRIYLNKGRASIIKHKDEIDIDVDYLKKLWENQNGICPYTNIPMLLPRNTKEHMSMRSMKKASLDRIDSKRGYLKGNVEFVCCAINLAKNSFTRKEMKEFLKEIGGPAGERSRVSETINS